MQHQQPSGLVTLVLLLYGIVVSIKFCAPFGQGSSPGFDTFSCEFSEFDSFAPVAELGSYNWFRQRN